MKARCFVYMQDEGGKSVNEDSQYHVEDRWLADSSRKEREESELRS